MKKTRTKEQILDSAMILFQEKGFEKTSMEDVAQKVQLTKRSIYNYFPTKESLYFDAVKQDIENLKQGLGIIIKFDTLSPLERLREYLIRRNELIAQSENIQMFMKSDSSSFGKSLFDKLTIEFKDFYKWERSQIKIMLQGLKFTPKYNALNNNTDSIADLVHMSARSTSYLFFIEEKFKDDKQSFEILINLFVDALKENVIGRK
ncbi:MAG: TetR/AcrR family transcriptional regulator [Bacteroidales bacterium]|nr:TetR/AcrR family transcriptional regulator [Bacteroidales bacterium]